MNEKIKLIRKEIEKQNSTLNSINEELRSLEVDLFELDSVKNNLTDAVLTIVESEKLKQSKVNIVLHRLSQYIHSTMVVSDSLDGLEGDILHTIKLQREVEKAKRIDRWILWSQQTLRWTAGVAIAVFLYSSAVYLSDDSCLDASGESRFCLRIPIKDWIPK